MESKEDTFQTETGDIIISFFIININLDSRIVLQYSVNKCLVLQIPTLLVFKISDHTGKLGPCEGVRGCLKSECKDVLKGCL